MWPHSSYPLIEVGRMVLDRNPANYFAEVEQLAFAPSHLVPGIEPSPDKMLQARLFSYADTHRHRLGVNYQSIPVNCPFATTNGVHNYQRDGNMRVNGNQGNAPNYFPNSFGGPQPLANQEDGSLTAAWHQEPVVNNTKVARYETGGEDNFSQCGQFYRKVLNSAEQDRLADNIAGSLSAAQEFIQQRAVCNFAAADAQLGRAIKQKLEALKQQQQQQQASSSSSGSANPLSPPRTVQQHHYQSSPMFFSKKASL